MNSPDSPPGTLLDWEEDQVCFWLDKVGYSGHDEAVRDQAITGDVLSLLSSDDLRDLGIPSLGHRLGILKMVHQLKVTQGLPIEEGSWVPSVEDTDGDASFTSSVLTNGGADSDRIWDTINEQNERISYLEQEYEKLYESFVGQQQQDGQGGARTTNDGSAPSLRKQPSFKWATYGRHLRSPTHPTPPAEGMAGGLDSPAIGAGMMGRLSPKSSEVDLGEPKPAPPPLQAPPPSSYNNNYSGSNQPPGPKRSNSTKRSPTTRSGPPLPSFEPPAPAPPQPQSQSYFQQQPPITSSGYSSSTTSSPSKALPTSSLPPTSSSATPTASSSSHNPPPPLSRFISTSNLKTTVSTPPGGISSSSSRSSPNAAASGLPSSDASTSSPPQQTSSSLAQTNGTPGGGSNNNASSSGGGSGTPGASGGGDTYTQKFRVTLEDPCYKVLPAALKKYNINDDWRLYALFICYGGNGESTGTERCLSYDEKPLLLFQRLKDSGQSPVFMLRHIRDIKSPIAIAQNKKAAKLSSSQPPPSSSSSSSRPETSAASLPPQPSTPQNPHPSVPAYSRNTRLHQPSVLLPVTRNGGANGRPTGPEEDEAGGAGGGGAGSDEAGAAAGGGGGAGVAGVAGAGAGGELSFALSIYPYFPEREDEFEVAVDDTFLILSKAKGWWVVQRDPGGQGLTVPDASKAGWVPAGCLLETNRPPGNSTLSIVSTSYAGVACMDYPGDHDSMALVKDEVVRIFKRYSHWSYALKENGDRGWVPSWHIGKLSSTSTSTSSPTPAQNPATNNANANSSSTLLAASTNGAFPTTPMTATGNGISDESGEAGGR